MDPVLVVLLLVLILLLAANVVYLRRVDQHVIQVDKRVVQVDKRVGKVEEDLRYEIPPTQRVIIDHSILAMHNVKGGGVGVAFFVTPTMALTADHALPFKGHRSHVTCVRNKDGKHFVFKVVKRDPGLDFAVLRLIYGQEESAYHLTIPSHVEEVAGEKGLFLVTCNLSMAKEAPDVTSVGVAIHAARVVKLHDHHFMYDSSAFDGDSGGAIVLGRTGEVIGMHQQLVNRARDLIKQTEDMEEALNTVQVLVKSLIQSSAFGCVGLRIDADQVRLALA
jgi:hypothetical protein